MSHIQWNDGCYKTTKRKIGFWTRLFPTVSFWSLFFGIVVRAGLAARAGKYGREEWAHSSWEVLDCIEAVGAEVQIEGINFLQDHKGPCVIVGNHMSLLETGLLPVMVLSSHFVTFVVKESLTRYPLFRNILSVCKPVAISRTNPRADLKAVLGQGAQHLAEGTVVAIFPQSTRSCVFDPAQMSSIGVKLAKKAGVPIIPLALKTDALKNGRIFKDIGSFDASIPVRFAFGKPIMVQGKGVEEQKAVTDFIGQKLCEWGGDYLSSSSKSGSSAKSSSV